jgi:electron transport complex protein RnfG
MNKIIKDACILFAITLVAGILLGAVYDVTKAPIAAQNEKAKQEAYKAVLPDADTFEAISGVTCDDDNVIMVSGYANDEISDIVAGVKNNKIVGYVITVTDSAGYAGDIKFSVGVGTDGTYKGTSILSISETAGLGMRAKTDPSFLSQFNNVKVDSFTLVKDGTGSSADDKIDAISGSTVTSKAMTSGINAALAEYSIIRAAGAKTVGGAGIE